MTKFYRSSVTINVLSEYAPVPEGLTLDNIYHECEQGAYVLADTDLKHQELNGKEMADALYQAGSDPEFFSLNDEGDETDE